MSGDRVYTLNDLCDALQEWQDTGVYPERLNEMIDQFRQEAEDMLADAQFEMDT